VQAGGGDEDGMSSVASGLDNVHDTISTMTAHGHGVRLPEGMTEERALSVYDNYILRDIYNPNLPITRYRQEVHHFVSVSVFLFVYVFYGLYLSFSVLWLF